MHRIFFVLLFIHILIAAKAQIDFDLSPQIETGNHPIGLKIIDLNNDDVVDLVYLNEGDNTISYRFGLGNNTYQEPKNLAVIGGAKRFELADVNDDGILDMAVTLFDRDSIAIFTSENDLLFTNRVQLAAGDGPTGIKFLNIVGDSRIDLVATFFNEDSIGVYEGLGDGNFNERNSYDARTKPNKIRFFENSEQILISHQDGVSIYKEVNNRLEEYLQIINEIQTPIDIEIADFNSDDREDIIILSHEYKLKSFIQNELGDFELQTEFNDNYTKDIHILDIQGDGYPDLVLGSDDGYLSVLINEDGTFDSRTNYLTYSNISSIESGDVNNDNSLDIVATNYQHNSIGFYFQKNLGFRGIQVLPYNSLNGLIKADLNGDSLSDLAYSKGNGFGILYRGDSSFSNEFKYEHFSDRIWQIAAGDLNNDSINDIVSVNSDLGSISIMMNNGDSTFLPPINYSVGNDPRSISIEDFDHDGRKDILIGIFGDNRIKLYLNKGAGVFEFEDEIPITNPGKLITGYFNSDSFIDLIIGSEFEKTRIVYGGANEFFATVNNLNCLNFPHELIDINNDNILDILSLTSEGESAIVYSIGSSAGFNSDCIEISYNGQMGKGGLLDANGSGKMDIVTFRFDEFLVHQTSPSTDSILPPSSFFDDFTRPKDNIISYDLNNDSIDDVIMSNQEEILLVTNTSKLFKDFDIFLNSRPYNIESNRTLEIGEVFLDSTLFFSIELLNNGSLPVKIENVSLTNNAFDIESFPEVLLPISSDSFIISFTPSEVEEYETMLYVQTDDQKNESFEIEITAFGIANDDDSDDDDSDDDSDDDDSDDDSDDDDSDDDSDDDDSDDENTDVTTSIEDDDYLIPQLYPNPTSNYININFETLYKIQDISLTDFKGSVILRPEISSNTISLKGLKSGIYFLIIKTQTETLQYKILKN